MSNEKTYIYRVYTTYDPHDGFSVWTKANTEQEAEDKIRNEHHSVIGLDLLKITYDR